MNYNRTEAARYLGLGVRTLDHWRCRGVGPKYLKLGARVLYPQSELDAFKAACLRQSTAGNSKAA